MFNASKTRATRFGPKPPASRSPAVVARKPSGDDTKSRQPTTDDRTTDHDDETCPVGSESVTAVAPRTTVITPQSDGSVHRAVMETQKRTLCRFSPHPGRKEETTTTTGGSGEEIGTLRATLNRAESRLETVERLLQNVDKTVAESERRVGESLQEVEKTQRAALAEIEKRVEGGVTTKPHEDAMRAVNELQKTVKKLRNEFDDLEDKMEQEVERRKREDKVVAARLIELERLTKPATRHAPFVDVPETYEARSVAVRRPDDIFLQCWWTLPSPPLPSPDDGHRLYLFGGTVNVPALPANTILHLEVAPVDGSSVLAKLDLPIQVQDGYHVVVLPPQVVSPVMLQGTAALK